MGTTRHCARLSLLGGAPTTAGGRRESLEETLELLGDHDAIRELVEAEAAVAAGDVLRGVDAVRALRTPSQS